MRFVLVHGWGFHAGIFADFIGHLEGAEITLIDLGFVAGGPKGASDWPSDAIAIGHSLGLLWLLQRGQGHFKALVSVQGFDCFCCHVAPARVAALRRGLERDPGGTLQAFWRSCGASGFALPAALNLARLDEGLDWLMHWDAQKAKGELGCPTLALASRDDPIVPAAMSEAIWKETGIVWSPDGGHVLPLRHPRWCARHVLEFAHALPS
jgi:pimeloyl-[acyl-carrier protein] methyl ester esterase